MALQVFPEVRKDAEFFELVLKVEISNFHSLSLIISRHDVYGLTRP